MGTIKIEVPNISVIDHQERIKVMRMAAERVSWLLSIESVISEWKDAEVWVEHHDRYSLRITF